MVAVLLVLVGMVLIYLWLLLLAGRLLLTAVSLGSTVSLLRISLMKRDIKKRQAFIREFKTALKAC